MEPFLPVLHFIKLFGFILNYRLNTNLTGQQIVSKMYRFEDLEDYIFILVCTQ